MPRARSEKERVPEAARLRALRARTGLSQAELAKAFNVAKSAVAQWEAGTRTVPGPVLELIDAYEAELGVEPAHGRASGDSFWLWAARTSQGASAAALWIIVQGAQTIPSPIAQRLRDAALRKFVKTLGGMRGLSRKLLDMVAYMDFVLPDDAREVLASTLATASPPMSPTALRDVFVDELGRAPKALFREWSSEPVAVASVGQVHRATSPSGEALAVKVQHPKMVEILRADLHNVDLLDGVVRLVWPSQQRGVLQEELRRRLLAECDYRLERENLLAFTENFAGRPGMQFPRPVDSLCTSRVLSASWVSGRSLAEFTRDASQSERDRAGRLVWIFFYESLVVHGRFHADPHPGNVLFTDEGVGFLDFGRVKVVTPEFAGICRRIIRAILESDFEGFRRELVLAGCVGDEAAFDFGYAYRMLLAYSRPYLVDDGFLFTIDYVRDLWKLFTTNVNRAHFNFPPELVFFEQLYFGVGSLLARIGGRVECRRLLLDLVYAPGEPRPAPLSPKELLAIGL